MLWHLQDPELDIFMVEILVYSIIKWIQALLARLPDNRELKIGIPSLLFVHCNKHLFVLLRNTCILSCRELFNVGHVEQNNQMMPGSPIWRKWGPKPLLALGATIPVMLWSSGHSMTVTQQNYQLSLCWNNHQIFHDTNTYIHQGTPRQDFWIRQGILKSCFRWSACLRATLNIWGNKYFKNSFNVKYITIIHTCRNLEM